MQICGPAIIGHEILIPHEIKKNWLQSQQSFLNKFRAKL